MNLVERDTAPAYEYISTILKVGDIKRKVLIVNLHC